MDQWFARESARFLARQFNPWFDWLTDGLPDGQFLQLSDE